MKETFTPTLPGWYYIPDGEPVKKGDRFQSFNGNVTPLSLSDLGHTLHGGPELFDGRDIASGYIRKLPTPRKPRPIKVGDMVYATKNSQWGTEPMKVIKIHHANWVSCQHPTLSMGAFTLAALAHVTPERKLALKKWKVAGEVYRKMEIELFG